MGKGKRLSREAVLGQKGINVIERIVLDMGSRWTPAGPNEIGIDGYIELFDPGSGKPLGKSLAVQSKAVSRFRRETDDSFSYSCARRDIDYWLQGNMPIILVVSRPDTEDAYWISVKDYFGAPEQASSSTVLFSKSKDRLTQESIQDLVQLGRSHLEGLYLAPAPRREKLLSNLLELERFPGTIWVGRTDLRYPGEVWAALRASRSEVSGSWFLRSGTVVSFSDLGEHPWDEICDLGTVETFDTTEWSEADDPVKLREFVELLNRTLKTQLYPDVRLWDREGCYAMSGSLKKGTSKRSYRSLRTRSKLAVVTRYEKETADGRQFQWLRHLAFRGQFRRIEEQWYLEITPTYRFTRDGLALDRFHESRLKGIKKRERNRAVLSAVLYWADYLSKSPGLFERPLLVFGNLLSFEAAVGLSDAIWSASADDDVQDPDLQDQMHLLVSPGESEE